MRKIAVRQAHIQIHSSTYTHVDILKQTCTNRHTDTHRYTQADTHRHTLTDTHSQTHTQTHINNTDAHIDTYSQTHTYRHTLTHTHSHTHTTETQREGTK